MKPNHKSKKTAILPGGWCFPNREAKANQGTVAFIGPIFEIIRKWWLSDVHYFPNITCCIRNDSPVHWAPRLVDDSFPNTRGRIYCDIDM